MSRAFWACMALVSVFGLSASQASARGGHGGGGHHGGGHHGGGHHAGHHSHEHHHSGHHAHTHHGYWHHYHHANWAHHNRPFSHDWYGRRGRNWGTGWGGWGWGNPWAISTFGATAAWLGLENATPIYGNYGGVANVLTSDATTTDSSTSSQAAALQSEPEQLDSANQLVAEGKTDPEKETAFLPLGVFSIAPAGQSEASAMVQLAISKAGIVRGTYYDLLSDHDQPIRGSLNKKTQQLAFTFGDKGKVTFETSLANLTQDKGALAAHCENGVTNSWTIARYAKEPLSEDDQDDADEEGQAQEGATADDDDRREEGSEEPTSSSDSQHRAAVE